MTDHCSRAKLARNVKVKGFGDGRICKVVFAWLQELGYGKDNLKDVMKNRASRSLWMRFKPSEGSATKARPQSNLPRRKRL